MGLKRILTTIFLCWWQLSGFSQSAEVKSYLAEITSIIKNKSIVANNIDWVKYEKDLAFLSQNINEVDSCRRVLDYITVVLRKAGDRHSAFIDKQGVGKLYAPSQPKQAEGRLIDAHTGYLKVPGIMSFNDSVKDAFRDNIQQHIKKLDTENEITGWIVDLRHNTGGDLRTTLAGLNALIKDGVVGYFIDLKNKRTKIYSYGQSFMGRGNFYKIKKRFPPIAVLIDSFSASSGEMAAMSFIGLRNVRTFGQPSAGYTTANEPIRLSSGVILALAYSYAADRKKRVYRDRIIPDVLVKENTLTADGTLDAAKKWTMRQK
ncbi:MULTISPECIES: S41 family peptidase [Niastella]|uniref:S41 family peptidase n=1 Tax=Niastella soli TaxID=2821487 RepID=A0ABS3YVE9_9BACT|nr:S41 family peptidase [Niastella soli]MBO9201890.1 S41 family peptidase [Niastella soli]